MEGSNDMLQAIRKVVDDLYCYRDKYFENHGFAEAGKKNELVQKELYNTIVKIDSFGEDTLSKAECLMLKGKALNIQPEYNQEAQELLSKAVKLDPKSVEAWVHLGECFWKNKDIDAAKNCFSGALQHAPEDKVALRNLSMVLRQSGTTPEERIHNIEDSVLKAKAAVQKELNDGTSWLILGNAYLSLFFASTQNPKTMKQCLSAYQQAERDPVAMCNPDLHFNRASAYQYQEEYELALVGFARAATLEPTWDEAKQKEDDLMQYLEQVTEQVQSKGKLKAKKLQNFTQTIKESDLGPYSSGKSTVSLESVMIGSLKPEFNKEKVICGKVVCSVTKEEVIPCTVCIVDREANCASVTIYNISADFVLKIGDVLTVVEPFVSSTQFEYKNKCFKFKNIRVDTPSLLVVNGKKLGPRKVAAAVLSVDAVSE